MDIKYNLQDLSDVMMHKNALSRKDADTFVRAFFETISSFLIKDKIVKVKGLGTFKLVEVADRESVDVNTGQRIVISGHSKVSFTPDSSLRDQVNKPFVDFETVVLNDETDLSEMERIDEPAPVSVDNSAESLHEREIPSSDIEMPCEQVDVDVEESLQENVIDKPENVEDTAEEDVIDAVENEDDSDVVNDLEVEESVVPNIPESVLVEDDDSAKELDVNIDIPSNEVPKQDDFVQAAIEESAAPLMPQHDESEVLQKSQILFSWKRILTYAVVFLLISGSYFMGYYRLLCPCDGLDLLGDKQRAEAEVALEEFPVEEHQIAFVDTLCAVDSVCEDTICLDSVEVEEAYPDSLVPAPVQVQKQPAIDKNKSVDVGRYPQIPGGKYRIVGTKATHRMKVGDNLYKISRKTYGNINRVKYIVVYNQFKNPDVIPPGYLIKLPELQEVK